MAGVEIVPWAPEMTEALRAIWNAVIERDDAFVYDAPFDADRFGAMLAAQTAVNCALAGGRPVGFYILHPNFEGRAAHIANASYAVSPDHRGGGVGRLLGQHSIEAARAAGFSGLQFNAVVAANTRANRLWESLGFKRMAAIPGAYALRDGSKTALNIYYMAFGDEG